jgi:hypothetical protein
MFSQNPVENFAIWCVIFYFIPTLIAMLGRKRDTLAILILNLVAGWTFVGWATALIWSFRRDPKVTIIYR